MTLVQALLAAVAAETACIIFLFGILMAKNKTQDTRLLDCETDRKKLHEKVEAQQVAITDVWRQLALSGVCQKKVETP